MDGGLCRDPVPEPSFLPTNVIQKPVLPAKVLSTGEELRKVIDEHKEKLLGVNVMKKFDAQLPFLPKVIDRETT